MNNFTTIIDSKEMYNIESVFNAIKTYLKLSFGSNFELVVTKNDDFITYEILDVETNHIVLGDTYKKGSKFVGYDELTFTVGKNNELCHLIKMLKQYNNTNFTLEFIVKSIINKNTIRLFDLLNSDMKYNSSDFIRFISMLINWFSLTSYVAINTQNEKDVSKIIGDIKIISERCKASLVKDDEILCSITTSLKDVWVYEYDATTGESSTQIVSHNTDLDASEAGELLDSLIDQYPFLITLKKAILERNNISVGEILSPYCITKG